MSTNTILILSLLSALVLSAPLDPTTTALHLSLLRAPGNNNYTVPANATVAAINANTAARNGQIASSHDPHLSTGALIGIVLGGLVGLLLVLWVMHRFAQRTRQ